MGCHLQRLVSAWPAVSHISCLSQVHKHALQACSLPPDELACCHLHQHTVGWSGWFRSSLKFAEADAMLHNVASASGTGAPAASRDANAHMAHVASPAANLAPPAASAVAALTGVQHAAYPPVGNICVGL